MKKQTIKSIVKMLLFGFLLLNISAAFHGYNFTHFSNTKATKSKADELSLPEKAAVLFFGISNPRPTNQNIPEVAYESVKFPSGTKELEGWYLEVDSAKGVVILFHGYSGEKSSMLARANAIREMGYSTFLIDFRGAGGSSGNVTTIGYRESEDVQAAVRYLKNQGRQNIYLLGTSMGAAAILKYCSETKTELSGIIIECPFGSLLQSAKNRFERMGLPATPAAQLLVFWGGIENGFWGFSHNPSTYSESVTVPSLLIYGKKDESVKQFEIDEIFANLKGAKELVLFPEADHGNYLEVDRLKWQQAVQDFLH